MVDRLRSSYTAIFWGEPGRSRRQIGRGWEMIDAYSLSPERFVNCR